jgi:hypothetical protein
MRTASVLAAVCGLSLLFGTSGFTMIAITAHGMPRGMSRVIPAAGGSYLLPVTGMRVRKMWLSSVGGSNANGGGGSNTGGGGGGGGGGGDGGEEKEDNVPYLEVLAKAGKSSKDIPADLLRALQDGKITSSALYRFWELEAGRMAPFLAIAPFRDRLLADPKFINTVLIDMAVGAIFQGVAEVQVRKEKFMAEADFVCAGIATALVANFAAVYYSAPTVVPKPASSSSNALVQFLSQCPDNAFQKVAGQKGFTNLQRVGALIKPMPQLFLVGLGAAASGYLYTKVSMTLREKSNTNKGEEAKGGTITFATIGKISLAVGVYCAISTNLRYQIVSGIIEGRIMPKILGNSVALQSAASTLVRSGNTYLGSYWIVEYLRFMKLQKVD